MLSRKGTASPVTRVVEPAATDRETQTESYQPQQRLEDFCHYVMIAHDELANAAYRSFLDAQVSDVELVNLLEEDRRLARKLTLTLERASRIPGLRETAAELRKSIECGRGLPSP